MWVSRCIHTDDLSELFKYLAGFRMTFLDRFLGEDEFPVHFNLERASARGDQIKLVNDMLVATKEFIRQTDGSR